MRIKGECHDILVGRRKKLEAGKDRLSCLVNTNCIQ